VGELWLTTATTGQLLKAAHAPDGKILNALDFPMGLASLDPPPKYSTDLLRARHYPTYARHPVGYSLHQWCKYLVPYR